MRLPLATCPSAEAPRPQPGTDSILSMSPGRRSQRVLAMAHGAAEQRGISLSLRRPPGRRRFDRSLAQANGVRCLPTHFRIHPPWLQSAANPMGQPGPPSTPTRREPVPGWRPWKTGFETLSDPTSNPATWLTCHPATTSTRVASTPLRGPKLPLTAAKPPRLAPPLQSPFPGPNVIETPLPQACRCHSPRLAMSLPSGTDPF